MLRRYKLLWTLGIIVVILIGARVALPSVMKDYINKELVALEAYDGHVGDVDLALWRGAYKVHNMRIVKTGVESDTPFFDGELIDFSVEWQSLLRGSLVAECVLWRPNVNLVRAETDRESQLGTEVNWGKQLERAFPFRFNTVRVVDGTATFRTPGIRTKDALKASNVNGLLSNMTNVVETGKEAFAGFEATAAVLESGSAEINGSADPLARQPTFDVNLKVTNVRLPEVNPWLREYIKADAESGEFELYTELAAAEGKFRGYAKPIMRNVDIYSSSEEEGNPLKRLWEAIVDLAADIVEDEGTEQVAARIPLSGTLEDPEAGIFETVASVLRNAFVSAFARSLEGSISIGTVKKSLKKVGEKDSKKAEEKKKREEKKEREEEPISG